MRIDDFDFVDYYKNTLRSNQERTYFRELICKKLNVSHRLIHQWIYNEKVPAFAEIHIVDIINKKCYELPQ